MGRKLAMYDLSNGNRYRLEYEPNRYKYFLYNDETNSQVVGFRYDEGFGMDRIASLDSVEKLEEVVGGSVEQVFVTHPNVDPGELQEYVDAEVTAV